MDFQKILMYINNDVTEYSTKTQIALPIRKFWSESSPGALCTENAYIICNNGISKTYTRDK